MANIDISPLPSDALRSLIIMAAREGQAELGRAPQFAAESLATAASLARDYAAPPATTGD